MILERIRNLREDQDLTQKQVADYLNVDRRTYGCYERGERTISPEVLIKLAKFFHVSADYLLGLSDDRTPSKKRD